MKNWDNELEVQKVVELRAMGTIPPDIADVLNKKFWDNELVRTGTGVTRFLERKHWSIERCRKITGIQPKPIVVPKKPQSEVINPNMDERQLCQILSEKGYRVEKLTPDKMDIRRKVDTSMFEGEKIRFGVISCTHSASKYQQLTYLRTFYTYIQERGIKLVLHAGDVTAGIKVYKGQEYELFLHGEKAQRDYVIEYYPRMENGGKTIMIAGNHDYSFMKEAGCDIVENIAEKREDIEYWGAYGAYPILPRLKIYLQHASGGVPYAISYRLQKNIEQFAPDAKPDVYLMGHLHKSCALFQYRNVTAFSLPCFEGQTPYLRRKGLYPEIGGLIVEFSVNDKGRKDNLARMKFEWVPFYKPIEKDY